MNIKLNNKWHNFNDGKSVGKKGSENGIIIYDIEHIGGARITLEHKTSVAPFATTLGVYGIMFHTHFDRDEEDAKILITQTIQKIDMLIEIYDIPEEKQNLDWKEKVNSLIQELAEQ